MLIFQEKFIIFLLTLLVTLFAINCHRDSSCPQGPPENNPSAPDLSGLSLSSGTLSPTFSVDITAYNAEVAYYVTSITVTPTAAGEDCVIKVNEKTVASGTASQRMHLKVGANVISILITSGDGSATKIYTVTVTRLEYATPSHNADLAGLSLSAGMLSPPFSSGTTDYSAKVNNDVSSITVTPMSAGVNATIRVNDQTVISGSASQPIDLYVGYNGISIVVTTEDGTTKTYAVIVRRKDIPHWVEKDVPGAMGSNYWVSITSSSDGTKLAAVVEDGYIYTSTDGGATWTEQTSAGKRYWSSIASSSDGTKLAAAPCDTKIADHFERGAYIYTSIDGGATWTEQTGAGKYCWGSITSSSDGTRLAATDGDYIYTSTDGGVTWTRRIDAVNRWWESITSSADGTKLAAVIDDGYIYTSTDGGATWIEQTNSGNRFWRSISSSSDGQNLVAVVITGYIYTSTDGGATWIERTNAGKQRQQ
jgi:hypothetical protein